MEAHFAATATRSPWRDTYFNTASFHKRLFRLFFPISSPTPLVPSFLEKCSWSPASIRKLADARLTSFGKDYIYLVTKRYRVKMAEYWPSYFSIWTETKFTVNISSHLNQTGIASKGFIIWLPYWGLFLAFSSLFYLEKGRGKIDQVFNPADYRLS